MWRQPRKIEHSREDVFGAAELLPLARLDDARPADEQRHANAVFEDPRFMAAELMNIADRPFLLIELLLGISAAFVASPGRRR